MIRRFLLGLVAACLLCGTASAEYVLDDFSNVSIAAGQTSGVNVLRTFGGTASVAANADSNGFLVTGSDLDTFTVTYDWSTEGNYTGLSGDDQGFLVHADIPFTNLTPGWELQNPGADTTFTSASSVTLSYVSSANGAFASYGGAGAALTAVPEPTSLLMMGSVMAFGLVRRRKSAK